MTKQNPKDITRRDAMRRFVLGGAVIGARAAATGMPIAWLLDPRRALAAARAAERLDGVATAASKPQYLILSTSGSGDPVNCNAPGTYADTNILHPTSSTMTATNLTLGGTTTMAAAPWAQLPQGALDQMAFIHHATNTVVHPDEARVLQLMGAVNNRDQFAGAMARLLAPQLGTVQAAPISLSASGVTEDTFYNGTPQPLLTPMALGSVLASGKGIFATMQQQRDKDLDSLSAFFRDNATPGQQSFLDKYATSQTQVRQISQTLLSQLEAITDGSSASQVAAAAILVQLKLSPVVSIHLACGGDNHFDSGLGGESSQTVSSVAAISSLYSALVKAGISDQVTFAMINVFGRTMAKTNTGDNSGGRSHNSNHHVTVMMGSQVNAGVYGGVMPMGNDYGAMDIDSTTGAGVANGDIPLQDGLAAVGKTLGVAMGVDPTTVDSLITGSTYIKAAIKS